MEIIIDIFKIAIILMFVIMLYLILSIPLKR